MGQGSSTKEVTRNEVKDCEEQGVLVGVDGPLIDSVLSPTKMVDGDGGGRNFKVQRCSSWRIIV